MARLALGAKCGKPRSAGPGAAADRPGINDASAAVPSPSALFPKKCRRVSACPYSLSGFIAPSLPSSTSSLRVSGSLRETVFSFAETRRGSTFVQHLVQVQDDTGNHRPGRQFLRIEFLVRFGFAHGDQFLRRLGVAGKG